MDVILYFFRDKIVGIHYFIYAFVCLFLMFSIIGYLFKQKYGKLEIILNTSQVKTGKIKEIEPKKAKKEKKSKKIEKVGKKNNNEKIEIIAPIENSNLEQKDNQQEIKQSIQINQKNINKTINNNSISKKEESKHLIPNKVDEQSNLVINTQTPVNNTEVQSQVIIETAPKLNQRIPEIE